MIDSWKETTLGEVIELYDHKRIPLNTRQRSERQGEYPYYGAAGIIDSVDDYIFNGKYLLIAEDGSVITEDGKPVLQLVNGRFWVSNHAHVVQGKLPISTEFLYYTLSNVFILGYLTGTAQPKLSQTNLKSIKLSLPPLSVQRKVTFILSAYDDLIENNTRRIKILEDMAQTLYQEWFVHFRFPGHESVPMVESPLGPIPNGWELRSFGEISLNFDRRRKPLSGRVRSTMQGEYPYYGAAKVLDHINDYLFDGRYLLVGEDGSVVTEDGKPVLQLVTGKFWVNNHTHVVQGKVPISTNFLYLFMSNVAISGYVTGTAQPKINQQNLNRIPVILPPRSLLERFNKVIEPNFDKITTLNLKNANIRQTRDLLLPKLISGEIDVSELDIDTNGMQPVKGGTHIPYPLTDRLHADKKILGGKPVIKGTRLAVAFILDLLKQGWSEEEIVENYPSVAHEDIEACRAYEKKVTRASVSR